ATESDDANVAPGTVANPSVSGVKGAPKRLKYTVFTDPAFIKGPTPQGISQGSIGDCYLMSSMAAVSLKNPKVLKKMIKDNGDGTFTVTLRGPDGSPNPIIVSNEFPTTKGDLAFAQSAESNDNNDKQAMWPAIIEKAYAQQNGGYG